MFQIAFEILLLITKVFLTIGGIYFGFTAQYDKATWCLVLILVNDVTALHKEVRSLRNKLEEKSGNS